MEAKVIHDLVSRICNSLPINSQEIRPEVQSEALLQKNEKALIEISAYKLDYVANYLTSHLERLLNTQVSTDEEMRKLAQSQLHLLDLLWKCLQHQWDHIKNQLNPVDGVDDAQNQILLKQKQEEIPPPPLDEQLAVNMYKALHYFLASKSLPCLQKELQEMAGKVVFQLSSCNYENVINNIIPFLQPQSGVSEEEQTTNLNIIELMNFNQKHLSEFISKVLRSLSNQKKSSNIHVAIARVLHKAIWNWIDNFPMEFVDLCKNQQRLAGDPAKLFDIFYGWASSSSKKAAFWPVCTMLLVVIPDILGRATQNQCGSDEKSKQEFLDNLKKGLKSSKLSDVAVICYVGIIKASTYLPKTEGTAFRFIITEIEMDVTKKVFDTSSPFKRPDGTVDEQIMVDCLISLYLMSHRKVIKSLFVSCIEDSSPLLWKRVLVKCLLILANNQKRMPWNPTIAEVYSTHSGNIRQTFQSFLAGLKQFQQIRHATDKKSKAQLEKTVVDIDIMIDLIMLFRADPVLALFPVKTSQQDLEDIRMMMTGLVYCFAQFDHKDLSRVSEEAIRSLFQPENIARWCPKNVVEGFWDISSAVSDEFASIIISRPNLQQTELRSCLLLLEDIMSCRIEFIKSKADIDPEANTKSVRFNASAKMETALLIGFNVESIGLVTVCAQCLGHMVEEAELLRHCCDESDSVIYTNYDNYKSLATRVLNRSTGRQAQQKAVRSKLRRVERQTPGNTNAWEEIFRRYEMYTTAVIFNEQTETVDAQVSSKDKKKAVAKSDTTIPRFLTRKSKMEVQIEWTNFLGMISSLSGVTLGLEKQIEVPSAGGKSKKAGPEKKTISVTEELISHLIQNLTHNVVKVRETTKMMLGSSLSPAVYPTLFRQLYSQIKGLFMSSGQIDVSATTTLFVDQAISIVKLILESEHRSDEYSLLSDIGDLITAMIRFVRNLTMSVTALQTKHKVTSMLEVLIQRINLLSIPNEQQFRTDLVDIILEWTSEFSNKETNIPADLPPQQQKQIRKLIKELDVQILRAIAALLKNLALQGKDDEAKSQLFSKFFVFFTQLLTRCKKNPTSVLTPQLPDATIQSLSFLVTANIQHGLEYFVTMGYHEDHDTRSAFLRVLTNILQEGTEFSMGDEGEKYFRLLELILDPSLEVVLTLADVTPITEADAVAQLLVRIFEANDATMTLLRGAISAEVQRTDSANTLFRRNSMATKLLAAHCKLIGTPYLQNCLGPSIKNIIQKNLNLEIDPSRLSEDDNLADQQALMISLCTGFLDDIKSSLDDCPLPIREVASYLRKSVGEKFPGAEHTAVAGFIFLRYICPAIVAPDGYGVINNDISDPKIRRVLLLITKVLQNLANRVLYTKEPYMQFMNTWIEGEMGGIRDLLDRYATLPTELTLTTTIAFDEEQKEHDMELIHYHLSLSLEKMRAHWTSAQSVGKGNPLDKLTSIMSQLGPPPEPSKSKDVKGFASRTRPMDEKSTNIHFEKFMKRMASRASESDALKDKNLFYQKGKTKRGVPLFYYIARNLPSEIDGELFNFFLLKTIQPFMAKPYSLVVDLSMVGPQHQVQLQWITNLYKHIPTQVGESLDTVYFVHSNHFFRKFSKRLAKFVQRIQKKFVFCSNVSQLFEFVSEQECALPTDSISIDRNIQTSFPQVTRLSQNNKKDVTVRIGTDFVMLEADKKLPMFGSQGVTIVDIYHISQILELIANKKDNESFIMKYEEGGPRTIQLISPSVEQIIQQLTASMDRYNLSRPNKLARNKTLGPSDVPGTLLNMVLLNLSSNNHDLRIAAYNLLVSLCTSFAFQVSINLLESVDIALPRNSTDFVVTVSTELAQNQPSLTLEFLNEALQGISKAERTGRTLVLEYVRPWIVNMQSIFESEDQEKCSKGKEIIATFVSLTQASYSEIGPNILGKIWKRFGTVPAVREVVVQCLLENLSKFGSSPLGLNEMDCVEDIISTLAAEDRWYSHHIVTLLVETLKSTNQPDCRCIEEHPKWSLIEILLRTLLSLSYDNVIDAAHHIPELCFIVLMTFHCGDSMIRTDVHRLFVNIVHSLYTGRVCHEDKTTTLRFLLNELHQPSSRIHFGVGTSIAFNPYQRAADRDGKLEMVQISATETIANYVFTLLNCCTPHATCIGSPNHTKLLQIIKTMSFTDHPLLQPRAIASLGILCRSPTLVTAKLIQDLLTLLRSSLASFSARKTDLTVSILLCLTRMTEQIQSSNQSYFKAFFWIAMSILQIHDIKIFMGGVQMLEAVVKMYYENDCLKNIGLAAYCNSAKQGSVKGALGKLDQITGADFNSNFSFAVATHLLKGLKNSTTKAVTIRTLSTLVDLGREPNPADLLGYLAALIPHKGDDTTHLKQTIIRACGESGNPTATLWHNALIPDLNHAGLLCCYLATTLKSSDFEHEKLFLFKLFEDGVVFNPEALFISHDVLVPRLQQVYINSQNQELFESALNIFSYIFQYNLESNSVISKFTKQHLANIGFGGLAEADMFLPATKGAPIAQVVCLVIDAVLAMK